MYDKTLTVKKSRVLDAAQECPQSKAVLKALFPEVFVAGDVRRNITKDCTIQLRTAMNGAHYVAFFHHGIYIAKLDYNGLRMSPNARYDVVQVGDNFKIVK